MIAYEQSSLAPLMSAEYEIHYKRQQGSWDLVHVAPPASTTSAGASASNRGPVAKVFASWPNGTRLSHELAGLFCGTQYHIYLVAVGDKGRSEPSDTLFARTQGGGASLLLHLFPSLAFENADPQLLTAHFASCSLGFIG